MAVTITSGASSVSPQLKIGFRSVRKSANLVHEIIDRNDPDVTLKPAGLRTGTLEYFCLTLANALDVEAIHASDGVCVLEDTNLPTLNMSYVANGDIGLELDENRSRWVVSVGFQEVAP